MWKCHSLLIHLSVGHEGCFHYLAIINKSSLDIHMQVSVCAYRHAFVVGKFLALECLNHAIAVSVVV